MLKILHVVGARPNFIKVAPVISVFDAYDGIEQALVHTGQHYDENMNGVFFRQLDLPEPSINLEVGSASHAEQTAQIMMRFEKVVLERRPDLVLVYGDVNSTVAAALVCSKLHIPVGHIEAGLRSFDRTMPEEINRLLTDQISDLLFTPSKDGDDNLLKEGIGSQKIHFVGNVMIDTLKRLLPKAVYDLSNLNISANRYALLTLHRPSNVDDPEVTDKLMPTIADISRDIPVIFPIHPRTRQSLKHVRIQPSLNNLHFIDPLGYLDFLALQRHATFVITDSGGIQEETTYLGIPCITVRENTERPITVNVGTNVLVGSNVNRLRVEVGRALRGEWKKGDIPPLWDGRAAERIANTVIKWFESGQK